MIEHSHRIFGFLKAASKQRLGPLVEGCADGIGKRNGEGHLLMVWFTRLYTSHYSTFSFEVVYT